MRPRSHKTEEEEKAEEPEEPEKAEEPEDIKKNKKRDGSGLIFRVKMF